MASVKKPKTKVDWVPFDIADTPEVRRTKDGGLQIVRDPVEMARQRLTPDKIAKARKKLREAAAVDDGLSEVIDQALTATTAQEVRDAIDAMKRFRESHRDFPDDEFKWAGERLMMRAQALGV